MTGFSFFALLLSLTAVVAYLNHRFLRWPMAIGVMALALVVSFLLVILAALMPDTRLAEVYEQLRGTLLRFDAQSVLLHCVLGFLLFAAALHVNLGDLIAHRSTIALLATVGVAIAMFAAGAGLFCAAKLMAIPIGFLPCLLFGALIAPTDPIAVMSILKQLGAPKSLETVIGGESLFNDGIGVVAFLVMLGLTGLASGHGGEAATAPNAQAIVTLLATEALGGIALGLVLGYLVYFLMRGVDHYTVEVLLTVALVAGGYVLAESIHVSAPLAMVVAGLLLGNHGRTLAMSAETEQRLDSFWEMVDELLNAMLFLVLGLEVLLLPRDFAPWLLGLAVLPLVLLARALAVSLPLLLLGTRSGLPRGSLPALTWGGLKGGISVALALSIPHRAHDAGLSMRDTIIVVTYVVVAFSILVQGLSMAPLLRRLGLSEVGARRE